MRIIAGEFRSRKIKMPPGLRVRPTADRTRESVFNMLAARTDLSGARVGDMYAGSGALGLEALSRGAEHATFVDISARVLRVCRENAQSLGVAGRCAFQVEDALHFLRRRHPAEFDVLLADPPYDSADVAALPAAAVRVLKPGGFLILEHDRRHDFREAEPFLMERTYGGTVVSFFRPPFFE